MISTLAIVIAGVSLVIVCVTVYRNLPSESEIVLKSDHGANGPPPPSTQELTIVDSEMNLL
jgi:hypothetical protein